MIAFEYSTKHWSCINSWVAKRLPIFEDFQYFFKSTQIGEKWNQMYCDPSHLNSINHNISIFCKIMGRDLKNRTKWKLEAKNHYFGLPRLLIRPAYTCAHPYIWSLYLFIFADLRPSGLLTRGKLALPLHEIVWWHQPSSLSIIGPSVERQARIPWKILLFFIITGPWGPVQWKPELSRSSYQQKSIFAVYLARLSEPRWLESSGSTWFQVRSEAESWMTISRNGVM